tara:strand:+ start:44 stop:520 length:477 start_codon:yes stop_codon:yes gene_type:complete
MKFKTICALSMLLIPVRLSASELVQEEQHCMAEAVYFEARDQDFLGQIAVAIVIRNRMKDKRWPPTACGVVRDGRYWKGTPVRHKCQFSYWCDGKHERPAEKVAWSRAMDIAELVLLDRISIESLSKATHYHTLEVKPLWSKKYRLCATIGDHKFYSH